MSRAQYLNSYQPHFARHLHHLAVSGFYARYLDADDIAFIEHIREHGCVGCGSLADTTPSMPTDMFAHEERTVRAEELEFWGLPYEVDYSVERRVGLPLKAKPPRAVSQEWLRLREQRKTDKEIAAAELERERKAWEAQHKERVRNQLRRLLDELEWDRAAPKFGQVKDRHYIPQWKCDDERRELLRRQRANRAEFKKRKAWFQADLAEQRKRAEAEAAEQRTEARARIEAAHADAIREGQFRHEANRMRDQQYKVDAEVRRRQEAAMRERDAAKADPERKNNDAAAAHRRSIDQQQATVEDQYRVARQTDYVKTRIMALVRGTFPSVWTIDSLMSAIRCTDVALMERCLTELMQEGAMQPTSPPT